MDPEMMNKQVNRLFDSGKKKGQTKVRP